MFSRRWNRERTISANESGAISVAPRRTLVLRGQLARHGTAAAAIIALLVLVVSGLAAGTAVPTASTSPAASHATSGGAGSTTLAAAAHSLALGRGPAGGRSVSCGSSGSGYRCAAAHPAGYPGGPAPAWSPIGGPSGRDYDTMTYDAADGYVLLFGGDGYNSNYLGDTWAYHGGAWTQLHPRVSPPAREGDYLTFDALDGYVLLFGGYSGVGAGEFDDTWEFLGGQWTELISASACTGPSGATPCPSGRDGGAMTYDAADHEVVLFGEYSWIGDTWAYASGRWSLVINASACTGASGTTPCPAPRSYEGLAYDAAVSKVVLFGGDSSFAGATNDTWTFSAGAWTEVIAPANCTAPLGPNPCPAGREGPSLAWDGAFNVVVLFGGWNGTSGSTPTYGDFNDTWAFNGARWLVDTAPCSPATCPGPRSDASLAWDGADGVVVLFGGYYRYADTWTFDSHGTWSPITAGTGTLGGAGTSMAWDAKDHEVVLFGGQSFSNVALRDTWTFANGVWTDAIPGSACGITALCPLGRNLATMVWDNADGYVVLFGGENATNVVLNDTWAFSGGAWRPVLTMSQCASTPCPSARWGAAAAWDPSANAVVLTGGDAVTDNDTWEYSAGTWSVLLTSATCSTSTLCPAPRGGASLAWDAADQELVYFGGATGPGFPHNDTWTYANGAWTLQLSAAMCASVPCPPARFGAGMAYDGADGSVVLFGGGNGTAALADTWTWLNNTWTYQDQSYATSPPVPREFGGMVWDGTDGYVLLVGGYNLVTTLADSWAYTVPIQAGSVVASPPSIDLGQSLQLSASATGGGYGSYSFDWNGLPTGCLGTALSASVECTPTAAGAYWISATASDSDGVAAQTGYYTTVIVDSDPVVALSATASTVAVGQSVTFAAAASGGSGSFVTYTWTDLPTGCAAASNVSPTVTCTSVGAGAVGSWSVGVWATDSNGFSVSAAPVSISVVPGPWAISLSATLVALDVGQNTTLNASASAGAGPLAYVWSGLWTGCAATGATVRCAPSAAGTYYVTATALGADGVAHTSNVVPIAVAPALTGAALVVSASSVSAGTSVTFGASGTGGTAPWSFTWHGLPTGCFGGNSAEVTCAPTALGTYSVSVTVSDATGAMSTSAPQSVAVTAASTSGTGGSSSSTSSNSPNTIQYATLGLVVVVLVIALVALMFAARAASAAGTAAPPPREWSGNKEKAESAPYDEDAPSETKRS